jgi:methyl-accepting chemotaxis protein
MLMSRSMIGETFVQRIEKLTGTPVNLFLADRTVSAAALQEYKQLQADDALISANYTDLFSQPPVFNTLQLGDREFFQALLPIVSKESGNALVGWIAMAQDRQQSHAAVVKMVRMLVLVFLVCMVVIAPVTYLVAAMFSRKVGTVVDGLRDIAEGEGDLTHRLTMTGKDELADLSHWFNAIIENLHTIITRIAENANHLGKSSGSLASLADEMQSGARGVKTLDTRISQV